MRSFRSSLTAVYLKVVDGLLCQTIAAGLSPKFDAVIDGHRCHAVTKDVRSDLFASFDA